MDPQTDTNTPATAIPSTPQSAPEATMEQIAAGLPTKEAITSAKRNVPDMVFGKFLVLEGWTHWLFRLGFASIFLVNALYAVFEPESFASIIETNAIAGKLGMTGLLVNVAIFNDLILSVFILGGWRKRMVYAWAGAWLLLPAGMKLMNLVW